jgi:histidinol-phosphate aminotransferase
MSLREARSGSGRSSMVKLASNESLWGASPRAVLAAKQALDTINTYPMMQEADLLEALARQHGLERELLLVGNGADEILRLAAAAYARPGDEVLYPSPSFSAYRHAALLAGAVPVAVNVARNGANDLDAVLRAITPKTRLVYLCTPNNPTGTALSPQAFDHYLTAVPDHVLTVVDSAYHEFIDGPAPDFGGAIQAGHPIVWVRTFSKLYALAALRIGWAAAAPDVIRNLSKVREPFSVNSVGWAAAGAAIADGTYYDRVLQETLAARRHLCQRLDQMGLAHYESQANFVTVAVPEPESEIARQLLQQGFVVRPTGSFGLPGHIRVTVAPVPILEQFLTALKSVLPAAAE